MSRPPSSAFAFLRSALVVLLVAMGPLPGCSSSPPDVIIVLIDTLRYDRLGAYGSKRGLTPFLDSFAEQAYVFERAYAQSSWTNPSVASLFTSRYQWQHQLTELGSVLGPEEITLAELLGSHGYASAGFCANILVSHRSGFDQGFDLFRTMAERNFAKGRAAHVNHEALAWLDEHTAGEGSRAPVFLYLHYM